jgi:hydrogenase expression/formation protein HypC
MPEGDCNFDYRHQGYGPLNRHFGDWYTDVWREARWLIIGPGNVAREEKGGPMCLAIPGQVVELIDEVNQIAKVDVVGVRRNINVSLLANDGDHARPGDWVLIHVGFALSKVDEEEAHATLSLLQRMGAEYEQEIEELKASVIQ